jgi:RNA polymerase sigma-70 factor (ECF subfamily)
MGGLRATTIMSEPEFARHTAPYRRELLAHCYRMLGSVDDAEDVVQETYVRAWRAYSQFEGRSSVRSWLYRIATNACLTAIQRRGRRVLPAGLGPESGVDVAWLQPIPDALVAPDSEDPAAVVTARADLRLALIASLQYLSGRQRAVLILRDVLGWPAGEVAEVLETSTAAVKSTLQRARARLARVAPSADQVAEPAEPERRAQLARYIAAFEHADLAALARLLRADATLEVTPYPAVARGREACLGILREALGTPGTWRMFPTVANGQPAAVAYQRGTDGAHRAYGVAVLTVTTSGVARVTVFGEAGLVAHFGHPPAVPGS